MSKLKFIDFYEAWWYLITHAYFIDNYSLREVNVRCSAFTRCLDIDVQKVNSKTGKIDDDVTKNDHVEVWLEAGKYDYSEDFPDICSQYHVHLLDCGGATFEEAIVNLANLVEKYYPVAKYGTIE